MITSLKINDYDILSDERVAVQNISGLSPTDSVPSTTTSGNSKRITSTIRSNRTIQISGYVIRAIDAVYDDIYSNWLVGEELIVEVVSKNTRYTDKCIIQDIFIERFKPLVTFTIKICCFTAFWYGDEAIYEAGANVNLDKCDIDQHEIIITHEIQENETEFTVDFWGITKVVFDNDYAGQTLIIDCSEQTCHINGENKFYLVSEWQDGYSKTPITVTIPNNTSIKYQKKVRGVW